jgi:hypothetical protein
MPSRRDQRIDRFRATKQPGARALAVLSVVPEDAHEVETPPRGLFSKALTAAAKRIAGKKLGKATNGVTWQDEAYVLYDQVGELSFVTTSIANAMSAAELYVGIEDDDGDGWNKVDDREDPAVQALDALWGDTPTGMAEMLRRIGQHLFIAGESYLCGLPKSGGDSTTPETEPNPDEYIPPTGSFGGGTSLESLKWEAHARGEITVTGSVVNVDGTKYDVDDVTFIRIHRPHPRSARESDSPVRSSMPVCRELVGLTMHVSAQIDSRLAGAGVFVVPASATILGAPAPEEQEEPETFLDTLATHMITPIKDRDAASAVVPIVVQVPDEATGQFQFISFATPFDSAVSERTDQTIRRLALGLDAPAERLLGMGDANHWGAWQLSEDEVKLYIVPMLTLIRDALTTAYLRAVLEESGVAKPEKYVVLASTDALTLRPDRSTDAFQLHALNLITDEVLLEATGFGPEDMPVPLVNDPALVMALELVKAAPQLLTDPGLSEVVEQIKAALEHRPPNLAADVPEPVAPKVDLGELLNQAQQQTPPPVDPNAPPAAAPAPQTPGGVVAGPPPTRNAPAPSVNSAPGVPGQAA